jgi:spore coat protein A, manganese oxidase
MPRRPLFMFTVALAVIAVGATQAAQSPQIPIAGSAIPQFVNQLPLLSAVGGPIQTVVGNQPLTIHLCEFKANVLPPGAVPGYTGTWVWGYLAETGGQTTCPGLVDWYDDGSLNGTSGPLETYTGPVILNQRATAITPNPTTITWVNDLGTTDTTNVLAYKYSTDQTLHWADPGGSEENMCNHMAMFPTFQSECSLNYGEDSLNLGTFTAAPIPAAVHLHGGEVPPELDGGPDSWFLSEAAPGYKMQGHGYYTKSPGVDAANTAVYAYANTQEASPIWFHDHVLGATRLNVYAGLAGGYLIADPDMTLPAGLWAYGLSRTTGNDPTVPLVIQDRMFDTTGQLFFPADSAAGNFLWTTNPEHPYWVPEFVGDTILINGKAWPFFNVEPKRYRFLFLNGSNARTYEMNVVDPAGGPAPDFYVIATDGGYLDAPGMVKKLTMMPGERYEVILDFSVAAPGANLVIKNTAKTPFPAGAAPQGATLGRVMQLRVGACTSGQCGAADTSFNPAAAGAIIRATGQKLVSLPGAPGGPAVVTAVGATQNVQKTRALSLNEVMGMPQNAIDPVTGLLTAYPGGPLEILVNNTKWNGDRINDVANGHYTFESRGDFTGITVGGITTYYSELPQEGDTEIWEIVNLTADAHPIHLHLVQFQLISRQGFDVKAYNAVYNAAFPGGGWDPMLGAACAAGAFCPGFGPPMDYRAANNPLSGGKDGGNPDVAAIGKNGKPLYLSGKPAPPAANEAGWKDTVIVYPGQVTRIAVRWAPTDLPVQTTPNLASLYFPFDPSGDSFGHGYVWHCHIIDHEDNEMMRPDVVQLNPLAPTPALRSLVKGTDY